MCAQIYARPKQSVEHVQIRALKSYRAGRIVGEPFRKGATKVISHFAFELYALESLERCAATHAQQIRIGLRNAEIIREYTHLKMLGVLCECAWHSPSGDQQ